MGGVPCPGWNERGGASFDGFGYMYCILSHYNSARALASRVYWVAGSLELDLNWNYNAWVMSA